MNAPDPRNPSLRLPTVLSIMALAIAIFALLFQRQSAKLDAENPRDISLEIGRLTVGVVPAPPASFINPSSGEPEGYFADVAKAIAHHSGLQVTFVPIGWDTMAASLDSSQIDIVAGPVYMSEGRARKYIFSAPLLSYSVIVVAGKNSPLKDITDLKKSGLRVAVGSGGFDAEFVGRSLPEARLSVFPPNDPSLPAVEVAAGRADFAVMDLATARAFVAGNPELEIKFGGKPLSVQLAGFMFSDRRTKLRELWNIAMRNLELSGELQALDARYASNKAWHERLSMLNPPAKAP